MGLHAASTLITFLLQTTAEWGVCWLLVRLARSHRVRFRLWLIFFIATFLQWVRVLGDLAENSRLAATSIVSQVSAASAAGHTMMLAPYWEIRTEKILTSLAVCYGATLCGLTMQTLWGRFRLKKALKFRRAPSLRLSRVFREVSLVVPSRNSTLWVLPGLSSPATFGWLRPQVIVPAECEGQSISDLEAVFWHELSHVQRRDALWNTFLRGCRNVLWFQPCIHFAFLAISMERELACDQEVVEGLAAARDSYAACLLRFARSRATDSSASPCIELASGAAILRVRVESILTEAPQPTFASMLRRTFAGIAMLGAISALAPSLTVLLVARQAVRTFASLASVPVHEATFHAKHEWIRSNRTMSSIALRNPVQSQVKLAAPSSLHETDPKLAAAHRVGMNVLTEYGNSQEAKAEERDGGDESSSRASQPGTKLQPAWGGIAMGAIEHLGRVDLDHDHGR